MTNLTPDGRDVQGVLTHEIQSARVVQSFQGDEDVELAKGTLRVLLVSVALDSPFSDPDATTSGEKQKAPANGDSDIWLALEIGSDFSLPVKASQTVIPERQSGSYLFPSEDVPGASVRLIFASADKKAIHDFEDLLSDYCAFRSDSNGKGTLELLDEDGQLLGTIDGPWQMKEDAGMHKPGHEKDPVMLELPDKDGHGATQLNIQVSAAPRDENGELPASYQNDWLVRGAHMVSSTLVKGSAWAGARMLHAADSYVQKNTPPASRRDSFTDGTGEKQGVVVGQGNNSGHGSAGPTMTTSGRAAVTFSPQTHEAARSIRNVSGKVCTVSNRTTSAILGAASSVGDQIGKRTGIQKRAMPDGTVTQPKGVRGALNRSLVAFNVVLDGVTNSAERLLKDTGEASGRVIEHRYGSEAKVISGNVASVGRSAFVVYKDINGVRRKALLKVATGTIRARAPDGSEVILQHDPEKAAMQASRASDSASQASLSSYPPQGGSGRANEPPPYNPYVRSSHTTTMSEKRLIYSEDDAETTTPRKRTISQWPHILRSPLMSEAFSLSTIDALPSTPSWPRTPFSHRRHSEQQRVEEGVGCFLDFGGSNGCENGLPGVENGYESQSSQLRSASSSFACSQQSTQSSSQLCSTKECITPSKMVDSVASERDTWKTHACDTPTSGEQTCDLLCTPSHEMSWTPTLRRNRSSLVRPHNGSTLTHLWLSPSSLGSTSHSLLLPTPLLSVSPSLTSRVQTDCAAHRQSHETTEGEFAPPSGGSSFVNGREYIGGGADGGGDGEDNETSLEQTQGAARHVRPLTVACDYVQSYANPLQTSSTSGGGGNGSADGAYTNGAAWPAQEAHTRLSPFDYSLTPLSLPSPPPPSIGCAGLDQDKDACAASTSFGPVAENGCSLHLAAASDGISSHSPRLGEGIEDRQPAQLFADELFELQEQTYTEGGAVTVQQQEQQKGLRHPDALVPRLHYAALLSSSRPKVQLQQQSVAPHALHSHIQSSRAPAPPLVRDPNGTEGQHYRSTSPPLSCFDGCSSPLSSLSDNESQSGTRVLRSPSASEGYETDEEDEYDDSPQSPTMRKRIHLASANHHDGQGDSTMLSHGPAFSKTDVLWRNFVERSIHGQAFGKEPLCRQQGGCSMLAHTLANVGGAVGESVHQPLCGYLTLPPIMTKHEPQSCVFGGTKEPGLAPIEYDQDDVFQSHPLQSHAPILPLSRNSPQLPDTAPGVENGASSWSARLVACVGRPSTGISPIPSDHNAGPFYDGPDQGCQQMCCAPQRVRASTTAAAAQAPFLQPYGYASSPSSSSSDEIRSTQHSPSCDKHGRSAVPRSHSLRHLAPIFEQRLVKRSSSEGSMESQHSDNFRMFHDQSPSSTVLNPYKFRSQPLYDQDRPASRRASAKRASPATAVEERAASILVSIGKRNRSQIQAGPLAARKMERITRAERAERRHQNLILSQVQVKKSKPAPKNKRIKLESDNGAADDLDKLPDNWDDVPDVMTFATYRDQLQDPNGVRIFPDDMLVLPERFPLWYCRFRVPSSMDARRREKIFGLCDDQPATLIADGELRAGLLRSRRTMGVWREPESLLDMYNTRWNRGVSSDKVALCPICFENGKTVFLKTKASQYNYHLLNSHGISPVTKRPFDPPINFRYVKVDRPSTHDRRRILQGSCHGCRKWINLESVRDMDVQVPELYWWKHAAPCHKKHGARPNMGGLLIENELLRRILEYDESEKPTE